MNIREEIERLWKADMLIVLERKEILFNWEDLIIEYGDRTYQVSISNNTFVDVHEVRPETITKWVPVQ